MKKLTLQYTIDPKTWTDLRQKGMISFDEQAYLLNIIRTQDKYFKDIYLGQYLLQKIIKDALPKSKKSILEKKIPIACQVFDEDKIAVPDEGEILLKLEVSEDQVVTVDYQTWLYLADQVNKTVAKYDSTKNMSKLLNLPENELKIDQMTRVHLLDVLDPQKTMNFIPELKLNQVQKAYENANGQLSESKDY